MVCMWVMDTLLFSLEHIYINWLRDHTSWALVELEWSLKVFLTTSNHCLKFTTPRYTLLFLYSKIYKVHFINCKWSKSVNFPLHMSCMRYKHVFIQQENGGRIEKWEDKKDFIFSLFCLVGNRKVKGWKK